VVQFQIAMQKVMSSNSGGTKNNLNLQFKKVMGSDGNCKYLPMLSLSYVKLCCLLVSDCIKLRHCGKPGACII